MKRLLLVVVLGLSSTLTQAAKIDLNNVLTVFTDDRIRVKVSEQTVTRDNYSFLETTFQISPEGEDWVSTHVGPDGSNNVETDTGIYRVSLRASHFTSAAFSKGFFNYREQGHQIEAIGVVAHDHEIHPDSHTTEYVYLGGSSASFEETVTADGTIGTGYSETFSAQGRVSPETTQDAHWFSIYYKITANGTQPGSAIGSFMAPTITISVYDPGSLVPVSPVPEPETYALMALGLVGLCARVRGKARVAA